MRAGDGDYRGAPALNARPEIAHTTRSRGAGAPARAVLAIAGSPLEVAIWAAEGAVGDGGQPEQRAAGEGGQLEQRAAGEGGQLEQGAAGDGGQPADGMLAGGGQPAEGVLVMLHEGLGSVDLWRDFPRLLARASGRSVIAFSRHGHGRSGPPPRPRTPRFFEEEALEVLPALLAALNVRRPVLVGHSDGASIALIHAAHHPVGAVVALAPHVFVEELTLAAIRQARERYLHGALRERLARHHDDVDAAFFGWCEVWLDPAFVHWSIEAEVELIRAPMLLIQGTEDPYGTLEQLARIERRARCNVARLVLPGGHSPHREHAGMLAERIASFLQRAASV